MESGLHILPLAVVMVAGPQILSAFFLATSVGARRSSLAYLAGVVLGTVVASSVFFVLSDLAGASDQPRGGDTDFIDY